MATPLGITQQAFKAASSRTTTAQTVRIAMTPRGLFTQERQPAALKRITTAMANQTARTTTAMEHLAVTETATITMLLSIQMP